jgi:predicted glycoside hydrolase/deacetylase ChbG (UPF0249 family)
MRRGRLCWGVSNLAERFLIVNADDFGLSDGVNRGVILGHEKGIITRASLMVDRPAAAEAVRIAANCPKLGMGLHVDLGEWVYKNGEWSMSRQNVAMDDPIEVTGEVIRQVRRFGNLVGRDPGHLDSHQHVHREGIVKEIMMEVAEALGIPLRMFAPGVRFSGAFYGQDNKGGSWPEFISAGALVKLIRELPEGTTEMCCHPADVNDTDSAYGAERVMELAALCDGDVLRAIREERIQLI